MAFTRDAASGENLFNGEYLFNAQGEDVVAGVRTPLQVSKKGTTWPLCSSVRQSVVQASLLFSCLLILEKTLSA